MDGPASYVGEHSEAPQETAVRKKARVSRAYTLPESYPASPHPLVSLGDFDGFKPLAVDERPQTHAGGVEQGPVSRSEWFHES